MTPVTDPALLAQLESKPVTDPALIARLEGKKGSNSIWDVVRNAAAEGVAGVPDMFLNAPNRLMNLAQIPKGVGAALAGRPDLAPDMNPDPDLVRKGAVAARIIEPSVVPTGANEKIVDALVRGGTGGLVGGGGLMPAVLGAVSSLAATGAHEATGSPVAGMVAGLAVPGAAAAGGRVAPKLMQSALKPSARDVKTGNADAAIKTLLDEGINATKGGAAKLDTRSAALNDQIVEALANSKATVGRNDVANRLHDPLDRAGKQVNPKADIRSIEDAWTEFLTTAPERIPVQAAQEMKQGTYRALGNKAYGELKGADIEAQKALARGLKEEIGKAVPEVLPLNAKESQLLNAKKLVEHRAAVDGNKNPIGLGAIPSTGARTAAFLADRSALVKSLMARAMHSSGKAPARALAPLSFQEDALRRQQIIEALMGVQQ